MSTAVIGNLNNSLTARVFSANGQNLSLSGWTGIRVQSGMILVLVINPFTNVYLAMSGNNSHNYPNTTSSSIVVNVPIPVGTAISSITTTLLPTGTAKNEIFDNVEPFELTNGSMTFTYAQLFVLFVVIILIMYFMMNKRN